MRVMAWLAAGLWVMSAAAGVELGKGEQRVLTGEARVAQEGGEGLARGGAADHAKANHHEADHREADHPEPPTDEAIEAALEAIERPTPAGEKPRPKVEVAREAFAGISLLKATRAQIERISRARMLIFLPTQWEEATVRLGELAKEESVEGVRSAELLIGISNRPRTMDPEVLEKHPRLMSDLTVNGLRHPKLREALEQGHGLAIVVSLAYVQKEMWKEPGVIEGLEGAMEVTLPARPSLGLAAVFDTLSDPEVGMDRGVVERYRVKAAEMLGRSIKAGEADAAASAEALKAMPEAEVGTPAPREVLRGGQTEPLTKEAVRSIHVQTVTMVKFMKRAEAYLKGAYARGELMGKPAPGLRLRWSTMGEEVRSVADLKGKVVVLNFWTTWSGPSLAEIPAYQGLAARYKGSRVVILGVTSEQGYHQASKKDGSGGERVETAGDAEREMELMRELIREREINWDVAFSEEDVFNPEYGIRSLPWVVVVDPEGVVRHHGVGVGLDATGLREVVDGLLREFELEVPRDGAEVEVVPTEAEGAEKK